jgi:colicin D
MTPDWSATPQAVPYARYADPQTLNLYSYVTDDPVSHTDLDGHFQTRIPLDPLAPDAWDDQGGCGRFDVFCQLEQSLKRYFKNREEEKKRQIQDEREWLINHAKTEEDRDKIKKLSDEEVEKAYDYYHSAGYKRKIETGLAVAAAIQFGADQLQAKWKHAEDFGVKGNWRPSRNAEYEQALRDHVADPDTQLIRGTYRGEKADIFYNPNTNNALVIRPNGDYWTGWKLSPQQVNALNTTGNLQ